MTVQPLDICRKISMFALGSLYNNEQWQEDVSLKKWLDNQDVCDVLGISKRTLQTYREKGLLPFSRIRHKIFYKPEDVGKLLQSSHYPNTAAL